MVRTVAGSHVLGAESSLRELRTAVKAIANNTLLLLKL